MQHADKIRKFPVLAATILLFFCISFVVAFYNATTNEYMVNQKIDRGFIGKEAVFFTLKATSESAIESQERLQFNRLAIYEINRICFDNDVFLVSQDKTTRAVFFSGNVSTPPIYSGRFISEAECKSDAKLAVIGKAMLPNTWKDESSDINYIRLFDADYEVIGVVGIEGTSTLDDIAYVNIGSVASEILISGRFYIDGSSRDVNSAFNAIKRRVEEVTPYEAFEIKMPTTATDFVAGGLFMSGLLRVIIYIFLAVTYICILVLFIFSVNQKISVLLLNGFGYKFITIHTLFPAFIAGLFGLILSSLTIAILWAQDFFELSIRFYIINIGVANAVAVVLLGFWALPIVLLLKHYKLADSLR